MEVKWQIWGRRFSPWSIRMMSMRIASKEAMGSLGRSNTEPYDLPEITLRRLSCRHFSWHAARWPSSKVRGSFMKALTLTNRKHYQRRSVAANPLKSIVLHLTLTRIQPH
jgi:hypothetical protein